MKEIQLKKVLSIDMDYIMGNCIELYNDLAAGNRNEHDLWQMMEQMRNIEPHLQYDENKLAFIFDIFTKGVMDAKPENIMFARNHDCILNLLCTEEGKRYVYDVVNIDHHHDIFYSEQNYREVENFDFAFLNDWVWYLNKYNRLRTYTWVCNPTSKDFQKPDDNFIIDFIYQQTTDYQNPELFNCTYDYVFICCSPEWFPEKYKHLFFIMKQLAANLKQRDYEYRTDMYCVNEKSRPYEKLEIGRS